MFTVPSIEQLTPIHFEELDAAASQLTSIVSEVATSYVGDKIEKVQNMNSNFYFVPISMAGYVIDQVKIGERKRSVHLRAPNVVQTDKPFAYELNMYDTIERNINTPCGINTSNCPRILQPVKSQQFITFSDGKLRRVSYNNGAQLIVDLENVIDEFSEIVNGNGEKGAFHVHATPLLRKKARIKQGIFTRPAHQATLERTIA